MRPETVCCIAMPPQQDAAWHLKRKAVRMTTLVTCLLSSLASSTAVQMHSTSHNEQHIALLRQTSLTLCSSAHTLCITVSSLVLQSWLSCDSICLLSSLGSSTGMQMHTTCHNEQHIALLQQTSLTLRSSAHALCISVSSLASASVLAEL